jgi:hypothetical protein
MCANPCHRVLGSFAGAKFSSGMLPPEMIAELNFDEKGKYNSYFGNAASCEKFKPKGVAGGKTSFVVKTFRTKESNEKQNDEHGNEELRRWQKPVEEGLPYHLVAATAAIDIWSFGAVLYELHTGEALFAVNRDDDLTDAANMKELHEWNDTKKISKLGKVSDPSAYSLLKKVLSFDPSKRYKTMDEVLQDGYFTTLHENERLKLLAQMFTEKVTMAMAINTKEVLAKMEMSTSVLCKAAFEANEVDTPTCFIILPYKLPEEIVKDSESGDDGKWEDRFDYMQQLLDNASTCIAAPLESAWDAIKRQVFEKPMFLYLVDEYTGKPVVTQGGVYPIQITDLTENAKNFLPVMVVGMKAVAFGNTALGLIAMLYPLVPRNLIPPKLMETAEKFINDSSKPEVIRQALDDTSGVGNVVRGGKLRQFLAFLKEKDADSTFSGMKRLCDTKTGHAIWVTEDSAEKIRLGNDRSTTETEEVKQLKAEKAEYEMELKQLKAERLAKCTAEEVKQLRADNERRETELAKKETAEEGQKLKVGISSLEIDKKKLVEEKEELVYDNKLETQVQKESPEETESNGIDPLMTETDEGACKWVRCVIM